MRKKEIEGGEKRWKHSRRTAVTETMGQEKRRENSAEISQWAETAFPDITREKAMAAAPRPWLLPPRALLGDNLPLSKHSWSLLGLSSIFPSVLSTSTGHYVLKASTHGPGFWAAGPKAWHLNPYPEGTEIKITWREAECAVHGSSAEQDGHVSGHQFMCQTWAEVPPVFWPMSNQLATALGLYRAGSGLCRQQGNALRVHLSCRECPMHTMRWGLALQTVHSAKIPGKRQAKEHAVLAGSCPGNCIPLLSSSSIRFVLKILSGKINSQNKISWKFLRLLFEGKSKNHTEDYEWNKAFPRPPWERAV